MSPKNKINNLSRKYGFSTNIPNSPNPNLKCQDNLEKTKSTRASLSSSFHKSIPRHSTKFKRCSKSPMSTSPDTSIGP